jgi:putative acetyltransferase
VLPDFQGRGLGSALIREGLRRAEDEGWLRIFVVGEPAFYRRFGFSESMAARFRSPYAGPYSMGLDLNPATARAGDGEVIYPAPFGSLPPEG